MKRKTTLSVLAVLAFAAAQPALAACGPKCGSKATAGKCGPKCGSKCAAKCKAKK